MATSTNTILSTMEWAKRFNFDRSSGIGNNLEPALSSANMVMQTLLSPPFTWWWNSEEVAITCNPTLATATITNVVITNNVLTLTASNTFVAGQFAVLSGLTTATFLNGTGISILTATSSLITATFVHANYVSAVDTGTITGTSTQDYNFPVPDFSHIEYASVYDIGQTPSKWFELEVKNELALDSIRARPRYISPHNEDSSGNVTFRVMPAPDVAYPVNLQVQKAAPLLTSLNSTWAPIPDYMAYIYNWGFLSLMWLFADDARFPIANQKFQAGILARAEGLTEQERNVFLNNWNMLTSQDQAKFQQGTQARGV